MSATAQAPTGRAEEVVRWREQYESFRASLPATEPEWLRALRAAGIAAFEEIGFPTLKHEDWRHTSVAPIARTRFARATAGAADPAVLDALTFGRAFAGHQLVFVNGRLAPDLSSAPMADGVHIRSLREVLDGQPQLVEPYLDRQAVGPGRPFTALNSAFLDDGAVVFVPAGKVLAGEGIRINVTLCFTVNQALLAAAIGAYIVSPFIGRLDDINQPGIQLIKDVVQAYRQQGIKTKVLSASLRNPIHVQDSALAGADIGTMPFKVLEAMVKHPLTDAGIEKFLSDYRQTQEPKAALAEKAARR